MAELIEIDGSEGEGGGQVLRTALALSALTKKPVRISKIRAGREKPGLQPQHLASVKTIAEICGAGLNGAKPFSGELEFSPGNVMQSNFNVNIKTAGSVSLLLQQVLPVSMLQPLKLRVVGGTNVAFSPPVEFLQRVLFPALQPMGFRAGVNVGKRGFFPKGGGVVSFSSRRARLPLKPVNKTDLAPLDFIEIFSSSASLPTSVSRDQVAGARHALRHLNAPFEEFVESAEQSSSIGSSVSVFAHFGSSVLSGSALGARGKPAEKVGKEAAQALLGEIQPKAPCGSHLADQLLPFMALAKGKSEIFCSRITPHCLANIAVIERFLPVKFIADSPLESPGRISVDGAAFVP